MGLASALSTALTGLTAAEAQIDVVGNNLANSQTVGFKASEAIFATQFLQTQGLGSAPTATNGGTNPRQTGLGVQVAEITPDFSQGTIEISSNPSDLAIQGDGFFMVEGSTGEKLYTRNGIFKTNSENELVTITGNRLLGFGIDEFFTLQRTTLVPLSIPLGSAAVAQATQNVFFEGTLTPTGDVADAAEVIESATLGDSAIPRPDTSAMTLGITPLPDETAIPTTIGYAAAGTTFVAADQYEYTFTFLDDFGTESLSSGNLLATIPVGGDNVTLTDMPPSPGAEYDNVNIYRRKVGVIAADPEFDFKLVGTQLVGAGNNFTDTNAIVGTGTLLDSTTIDGNYSYLITYELAGNPESRPSPILGPVSVSNGRVHLDNFPTPVPGPGIPAYNTVNIYRNLANDSSQYFLVDSVALGDDYTDSRTDAAISDLATPPNRLIDLDGPKILPGTLLVDILSRDDLTYENIFEEGTLEFQARKGGRALSTKDFTVTTATTVQELIEFMADAMGIQNSVSGDPNPIPGSVNNTGSGPTTLTPGVSITSDGKIRFVANNGVDNALEIGLSAFQLTNLAADITNPSLSFGSIQDAVGQSAVTDFVVFDSLGIALDVRVTAVLEERTGAETVYRWFADSPANDPTGPDFEIAVGTGLVSFDGEGNLITVTNSTVNIQRRDVPSSSPLSFDLDFSQVSGLAAAESSLAAARQDGSSAGKLTNFIVGEDGTVRGVFSNGITRDLGQVRIARFANPTGLEQRGQNLFSQGVNSGLPIEGDPGSEGVGTLVSGAVELSNTDIGRNLIDLVLATTQYRGNSRVISTAQELLDELLNLRR